MDEVRNTRRTYGAGTTYIDKKSGRWIAQIYVPTADEKHKKRITGYGESETKAVRDRNKKAKEFQEEQQKEKEHKQCLKEYVETLQDYTEEWLNTTCKRSVEITTYENYSYFFYAHIKGSWLGGKHMNLITEHDLNQYYDEKLINGRSDGKGGLSARSVNYLRFLIKGSLRRAYDKGIITLNPHADVKKIQSENDDEDNDKHPLLPDEVEMFKQTLSENQNRLKYLFLFTLGTGLRKGEVTGLLWTEIDIKNKTLNIRRNLAYIKKGMPDEEDLPNNKSTTKSKAFLKTPKTKGSKRIIYLNDSLIECLIKQKEWQEKEKKMYKDIYTDIGLVFASETGDYLSHRKVLNEVKKVYKLAGIPTTHTFHDLRHTFCSILINKNINVKTVSRIMGHSSITITMDTYATIYKEMEAKAMGEVNDILNMSI